MSISAYSNFHHSLTISNITMRLAGFDTCMGHFRFMYVSHVLTTREVSLTLALCVALLTLIRFTCQVGYCPCTCVYLAPQPHNFKYQISLLEAFTANKILFSVYFLPVSALFNIKKYQIGIDKYK